MSQIIYHGSIIGREELTGFEFNPTFFFSGCLLCGEVYQTEEDRNPPDESDPELVPYLFKQKQRHLAWRARENNRHPEHEHRKLAMSGHFCTPEAAIKLAPLSLFSLSDLVASPEIAAALREAPRAPRNDAQTDTEPSGISVPRNPNSKER